MTSAVATVSGTPADLNGSKPLMVNLYDSAVVNSAAMEEMRERAARKRAFLSEQPIVAPIEAVSKVSSVTFNCKAIITGSHLFTNYNNTLKIDMLIIDPTDEYDGTEEIFRDTLGKNGEVIPAMMRMDKSKSTLWLPTTTGNKFAENLAAWRKKGYPLPDAPKWYEFKGPRTLSTTWKGTGAAPTIEIHTPVVVSISVYVHLFDSEPNPKKPDEQVKPPTNGLIISVRAHTMKKLGPSNTPLLTNLFVKNPSIIGLPVKSLAEMKELDIEKKNIGKNGKIDLVGEVLVTVPVSCGDAEFENPILGAEEDCGTLATLGFPTNSTSPFKHTMLNGGDKQIADLILTLTQWRGKQTKTHVVDMRLWEESLAVFGVACKPQWCAGLARAMLKQTPAFYTGVVKYTESDDKMKANTNDEVSSIMTLQAHNPVADVPYAIAQRYGIPVTEHFARSMALVMKRPMQTKADIHPLFTFVPNEVFKANMYNNMVEPPPMYVLNELEQTQRKGVFDDKEAGFQYFAVVGEKIMNDRDHKLLAALRKLRDNPKYKGPLGEMLTWKDWDPNEPNKWRQAVYATSIAEPECTVPPDHPVLVEKYNALASNTTFYIFAISTVRYNNAVNPSAATSSMLSIEGPANKKARTEAEAAAAAKTDGVVDEDVD